MSAGKQGLADLLSQFVLLRIRNMRDMDQRIFPFRDYQDHDLMWWAYFLSPEAELYSVFGDHGVPGKESHLTTDAFKRTMQAVLGYHYNPRRAEWGFDHQAMEQDGDALTPDTLEGWENWLERQEDQSPDACIHCHHISEILRQPRFDSESISDESDFYVWPLAENMGVTLDPEHGLLVTAVSDDSAASKLGVQKGDLIGGAGGRPLFSQTDLRAALHNLAWGDADIELVWKRGDRVMSGLLKLRGDWRRSDISWRKSVANADMGARPGISWPLPVSAAQRKSRGIKAGEMAIKPYQVKGSVAAQAGVKQGDVIVAINDESPDLSGRAFLIWFLLNFEPDQELTLTLADPKGKRRKVSYKAPGRR